MKTIFNAEALVSVRIIDKKECDLIKWKDGYVPGYISRLLGEKVQSSGYYSGDTQLSRTSILTGIHTNRESIFNGIKFIIEDFKVFYRPYVVLSFVGKQSRTIEFDTYEQALAFANEQVAKNFNAVITL